MNRTDTSHLEIPSSPAAVLPPSQRAEDGRDGEADRLHTTAPLVLMSYALCPYVQRVAVVLSEKGLPFERRDIDLSHKPADFLGMSPLGKTPVLLVGGEPVFESAVICEYLEEIAMPRLHPGDPLQRAQHRSWTAFASAILDSIAAVYNAPDETVLTARTAEIRIRLAQVETKLGEGPYFAGEAFSLVDAAFAPVFWYVEAFDAVDGLSLTGNLPKLRRWRCALAARPSVARAVRPDHAEQLWAFLVARPSALGRRLAVMGARA